MSYLIKENCPKCLRKMGLSTFWYIDDLRVCKRCYNKYMKQEKEVK